jgi:diguanylate cyclase (GGDEF)-like protein
VNGRESGGAEARWVERAAQDLAVEAERSTGVADQGASDADQTASDADQAAAERDEADAISDQLVADLEQARADLGLLPGGAQEKRGREASRRAREATRASRQVTHGTRAATARARLGAAADRDDTAIARDETARRRDLRADAIERAVAESDAPLAEKLERLRAQAAADRTRAAADRRRAAADRAAAADERAALESELHSAYVDELTGALRRKLGMLALGHEVDRARRGDGRLVCTFVDVDDLKRVNDRDGHAAGDRVLQALVSIMRTNLRSFDPIVRYGGDEFVCGLGAADVADVERRFELIDHSLHAAVGAGISVGLAALAAGETLDEVLARADAALLDAKRRREA